MTTVDNNNLKSQTIHRKSGEGERAGSRVPGLKLPEQLNVTKKIRTLDSTLCGALGLVLTAGSIAACTGAFAILTLPVLVPVFTILLGIAIMTSSSVSYVEKKDRYTLSDGSMYNGKVKDNMPHGVGVQINNKEESKGKARCYVGNWKDGVKDGEVIAIKQNTSTPTIFTEVWELGKRVQGKTTHYGEHETGEAYKSISKELVQPLKDALNELRPSREESHGGAVDSSGAGQSLAQLLNAVNNFA